MSVFPPTTFRNSPPIAPKLDPTRPPPDAADGGASFFAFCSAIIWSISISRSLSTNWPLPVLLPHDSGLISARASPSDASSLRSDCE